MTRACRRVPRSCSLVSRSPPRRLARRATPYAIGSERCPETRVETGSRTGSAPRALTRLEALATAERRRIALWAASLLLARAQPAPRRARGDGAPRGPAARRRGRAARAARRGPLHRRCAGIDRVRQARADRRRQRGARARTSACDRRRRAQPRGAGAAVERGGGARARRRSRRDEPGADGARRDRVHAARALRRSVDAALRRAPQGNSEACPASRPAPCGDERGVFSSARPRVGGSGRTRPVACRELRGAPATVSPSAASRRAARRDRARSARALAARFDRARLQHRSCACTFPRESRAGRVRRLVGRTPLVSRTALGGAAAGAPRERRSRAQAVNPAARNVWGFISPGVEPLRTYLQIPTFGESHGGAVGVSWTMPPRLPLDAAEIQRDLDRRRPGQSSLTTPRQEEDRVEILSGVFEGVTLGTPIGLLVRNQDARPSAYEHMKDVYRPSHADFTTEEKYGVRNWQGGGRASARETVGRVSAVAIVLSCSLRRAGGSARVGASRRDVAAKIDPGAVTLASVDANPGAPLRGRRRRMAAMIDAARARGDSLRGCRRVRRAALRRVWASRCRQLGSTSRAALMSLPASMASRSAAASRARA